jgi:hypothetical protein
MKIFYILSIILLISVQVKSQERTPSAGKDPVAKIVKFYPNPATSFITFDLQQSSDKNYNLQIFSFAGKKVQEVNKVTAKTTVNLNDFYRGVYIFQLRDQNGKLVDSGKFQVTK